MAALTSVRRLSDGLTLTDLLHSQASSFPDLLPSTTPIDIFRASVYFRRDCRTFVQQTSPVPSRLVAAIEAESCSLVIAVDLVLIRCFPPHLAVTQLLRVLVGTTATNGRGLPPRKRTLLCSALGRASSLSEPSSIRVARHYAVRDRSPQENRRSRPGPRSSALRSHLGEAWASSAKWAEAVLLRRNQVRSTGWKPVPPQKSLPRSGSGFATTEIPVRKTR